VPSQPVDRNAAAADLVDVHCGAAGGDAAGDVGRAGSVRKLGTPNSSTTEWCTKRSIARDGGHPFPENTVRRDEGRRPIHEDLIAFACRPRARAV